MLEAPKRCAKCKSPYWNKEKRVFAEGSSGANKYGFDKINFKEWCYFPYFLNKRDPHGVDRPANERQARALEQFMRRKGWAYIHKNGKNEKGEVCLMILRTG